MDRKVSYAGIVMTDGDGTKESSEIAVYLTRLTGRPVSDGDWVYLSSSQRARMAGWLQEYGISHPELRNILSRRFQPAMLRKAGRNGDPSKALMQTDIQRVEELVSTEISDDLKSSTEILSIFTLREISYAQSRAEPAETLTGLFAAKEALRKCDGMLLAMPLVNLEILPDEQGRPLYPGFALSISHSGGFAIAVAAKLTSPQQDAPVVASPREISAPPAYSAADGRKPVAFRTFALTAGALLAGGLLTAAMLSIHWR
jgi:phosphopantetheinyl transferase (holo-ACP synthase)